LIQHKRYQIEQTAIDGADCACTRRLPRDFRFVAFLAGGTTGLDRRLALPGNPDHKRRHQLRLRATWDKIWLAVFSPVFAAVYVVAGLDAGRFGWSEMPTWLWPVGLALFLPGTLLFSWSMGVNPFFEKTVRIQTERGHRVIDTGPYRFVRHPGYSGFLGWILSAPLLLGSWWAFLPSVLSIAALVVRTALEDRTLREELPGYTDYAARIRYRLIPKVW
jgi:protein-S-isoprenylcysteine O-methyltransferase Ste14